MKVLTVNSNHFLWVLVNVKTFMCFTADRISKLQISNYLTISIEVELVLFERNFVMADPLGIQKLIFEYSN